MRRPKSSPKPKSERSEVYFGLNGKLEAVGSENALLMLADFLRYKKSLTGTKIVCAEGDCGVCTVLGLNLRNPKLGFLPINSCIFRTAQADGWILITVDALAQSQHLTEVQSKLANHHASQCGYCTPGFVMALTGLAEKRKHEGRLERISEPEAKNALTGNLCRCTGYTPIVDAATHLDLGKIESLKDFFAPRDLIAKIRKSTSKPLRLNANDHTFFAPTTLKGAATYLKRAKGCQILGAGTDLGVVFNKGKQEQSSLLSLSAVADLYKIGKKGSRISVGSNVTLSELRRFVEPHIPEVARFLDRFASPQIKNVATLVGNVANASPIAECPPFLMALNATLHIQGSTRSRKVKIEDFFLGYRKTDLTAGEIIAAIEFDIPQRGEHFELRKVSQRIDLDISTVNAAFRITVDPKTKLVSCARIALGGVAATTLRVSKLERFLIGKRWSEELKSEAVEILQSEINPISDLRGSSAFRRVAVKNLLESYLVRAPSQ